MKWCAVVVLLFLFASGDKFLEHHLGVWIKLGLSPHDEIIHLSFALKQRNLDTLDKLFWQVSDPQSIRYGQFLTFQQLRRLVAPEPQGVQEVLDFFTDQGLRARVNPGGDYVDVDISVGQASSLLSATIESYQNQKTRLTYHRALNGYVLPKVLAAHVDHVFPLKLLPSVLRKRSRQAVNSTWSARNSESRGFWPKDCRGLAKDGMITPGVLRQRYNITMPSSPRKGSIAVALPYDPDDGCGFIQSDIEERNLLCGIEGDTVQVEVKGDGKSKYCPETCRKDVGNSCGESNLDVQTITALAAGVPAQFWIFKSGDPLDLLKQFNEDENSSLVLSCSFGDSEEDYDDDGGGRLEIEFKKAGVAGKTVMFASGDNGVWASPDDDLHGKQLTRPKKFSVGFPASSPYVTAVGGTQFVPQAGGDRGGDVIGTEMGVQTGLNEGKTWITAGSSGGGISTLFKAPSYQADVVKAWYANAKIDGTLPDSSRWVDSDSNRGYPDVAVLAGLPGEGRPDKHGRCTGECANYYLRQDGYWTHADGTSASSPAFAGMVAVLNEHRLAVGMPPMGAINTFLYQNAMAFDDITKGDNKYYGHDSAGFLATKGWDPVTGLGAPNVARLVDHALAAVKDVEVI